MVFRLGLSASLLAGRIAETLCPNYQHRALVFDLSLYYLKAKVISWVVDYALWWWIAIRILGNLVPNYCIRSVKDGEHF